MPSSGLGWLAVFIFVVSWVAVGCLLRWRKWRDVFHRYCSLVASGLFASYFQSLGQSQRAEQSGTQRMRNYFFRLGEAVDVAEGAGVAEVSDATEAGGVTEAAGAAE